MIGEIHTMDLYQTYKKGIAVFPYIMFTYLVNVSFKML